MKKLFLLAIVVASATCALAQSSPPIVVTEQDGSPYLNGVTKIVVSNGTLTVAGKTATITTGGGGGSGCTPPGTANRVLYDNGAGGCTSAAGFVFNGTAKVTLGVAGTSVGAIGFNNGTSGQITLQPVTGALGTVTLSLPAATDTLVGKATTDTLSNKTLASPSMTGNLTGQTTSKIQFGGANQIGYTDSTGPFFLDGNTVSSLIFNVQSLTADRTVTWPDATGTVTVLGNTTTGSGSIVLATTPTIATPSFTTGFTIGGTAATGTIPRGNGTNFVASAFTMAAPGTSGNVLTSDGTNWTSAAPSGGGSPGGSTTQLQYNNAGAFGGISGATSNGTNVTFGSGNLLATSPAITTDGTVTNNLAANTSGDGWVLTNTGTASSGNQMYSPRLRLTGAGWKTNATASSQVVDWIVENQPIQGAANPGTQLQFSAQVNGGGYTAGPAFAGYSVVSGAFQAGSILFPNISGAYWSTGNYGIYYNSSSDSSTIIVRTNGVASIGLSAGGVRLNTGMMYSLGTGSTSASQDVFLRRSAAANLAFGATDAASPVAQTLSVQNVVGGTSNTAGATWTHQASLGTSQGAPGRYHITGGAMIAASGTTQQTAVDRAIFNATKVLTNNSATTIVNVTNASNTSTGGVIDYCVEVFDGTDTQYECGMATYGISNKAGAFTGNTVTKFGNHQNATSGTLTVTIAISGANPGALSVNANSSLTPSTGYPRIVYSLRNNGNQAVAVQ